MITKWLIPPTAPKMSFQHGRHGTLTSESELAWIRYEQQMLAYRFFKLAYYRYLWKYRKIKELLQVTQGR